MASSFSSNISFLLFTVVVSLIVPQPAAAVPLPFHPHDVLPLLPSRVARPVLNSLRSAVDLLPTYIGAAMSDPQNPLTWSGSCFRNNSAWLELRNDGGTLHIEVSDPKSLTCIDLYVFATPDRVTGDYYFKSKEHTFEFKLWEDQAEYEYVKKKGISIFLMEAGLLETLKACFEVIPLFLNNDEGESANLRFLEKNMKATFTERPPAAWISDVDADDINSGDFLALSKIRGSAGAFETLEKWVTGAFAGHVAAFIRDPQGKLWVAESGRESESDSDQGEIIALTAWEEWWEIEKNKDKANPHIALLRLSSEMRAKFNNTAAWDFVSKMNGKTYGYHNLIFSWIDTFTGNYPPPLDANLIAAAMTVWNSVKPESATNLWNQALNLRLGTQGLDFPQILEEVEERGSSFDKLLAIPEQDNWIYDNGKSVTCVAFAVSMYKEAGLFGPLAPFIQATEFTVRDGYSLKFYENELSKLPKWCNEGDSVKMPYCQILGKYRMELPEYNTIDPYKHMNENCPSLPPDYARPNNC